MKIIMLNYRYEYVEKAVRITIIYWVYGDALVSEQVFSLSNWLKGNQIERPFSPCPQDSKYCYSIFLLTRRVALLSGLISFEYV